MEGCSILQAARVQKKCRYSSREIVASKQEKISYDVKVYTMNDLRRTYHILSIHSIAFPILVQKE